MANHPLPLITIITPTYNCADYLPETIESVLSQGYPSLEYILLDDGSEDNSVALLEKYSAKIIWESHPNMGETRTVNKGFAMAHGGIIGVVNSDDPLLPGALHSVAEYMQSHPDVGVVYPDWDMIDADGKVIQHITTFNYNYIDMLRWHHCVPGPGAFFRRLVLEGLGGRDPQFRYVADFDFWLRAGLLGSFARIPHTLATFRWHPAGASSDGMGALMAEEHIRLVNKIYMIPDLPREAVAVKLEAYSSAHYVAGVVCGDKARKERRHHFWQAIRYKPGKYLFEYRDRLPAILATAPYPMDWILCHAASLLLLTLGVRRHGGI
jgi:glycosyltransferase involved in cell wall biosynthesis